MDVREFYAIPWVAESILEQCYRRFVTLQFDFGLARHYSDDEIDMLHKRRVQLWRVMEEPFYEIHQFRGDFNNPIDLAFFLKKGVMAFIPEVSTVFDLNRTDTIIIDLDPKSKEKFTFEDTRGATTVVAAALLTDGSELRKEFNVIDWKYRFSGNRSFHLYIRLDRPHPFIPMREAVKRSLDVVTKLYPKTLSYKHLQYADGSSRDDFILIDIGALSRHRCVRSLWSVHSKTNLVCVPVEDLVTFDKETASIEKVLERGKVEERFV